ncbi:MAG: hypothetical protein JW832_10320 [Deltaproteobacteria bacterium]|nr:hypothetical protein [Deltaproteobacteria bacterium]
MKTKFAICTLILMLSAAWLSSCGSSADDGICGMVQTKLGAIPGATLEKTGTTFTIDGKSYTGCVFRLKGKETETVNGSSTSMLLYPEKGSPLHKDGWRASDEADGPEGAFFKISRSKDFCQVSGSWELDDEADQKPAAANTCQITIICGTSK